MRKRLTILLPVILCIGHSGMAQQITFSGTLPHQKGDQLHLTGAHHLDIAVPIDTTGRFGLALPGLSADFYSLTGVGDVYLAPGDSLIVDTTIVFTGRGALENNLLQESRKAVRGFPFIGATGQVPLADQLPPDTFLYRLRGYEAAADAILDQSPNAYFKQLAKKNIRYYCVNLLTSYGIGYGFDYDALNRQMALYRRKKKDTLFTFNADSANKAVHPRAFTTQQKHLIDSLSFENHDMNDSVMYVHFNSYRVILDGVLATKAINAINSGKISYMLNLDLAKLIFARQLIRNSYILGEEAYTRSRYIVGQSPDQHLKDSVYQAFMHTSGDPVLRQKLEDLYHHDQAYAVHRPAPDFHYIDPSGKWVTLSSLKGKYVYIDVWATWCGPCKEEIPYFKELADTYKGRNIYFVGLSIDRLAERSKWVAFVRDNQMAGIQVLADKEWDSDFVKQFGIQGIPRFILIDPKGNVVSANDKRPSDDGLKGELDGLLR